MCATFTDHRLMQMIANKIIIVDDAVSTGDAGSRHVVYLNRKLVVMGVSASQVLIKYMAYV